MVINRVEGPGISGIFGRPGGLWFLVDSFPVGGGELGSGGEGNRFVSYWELQGNFRYLVEGQRVFARKLHGNPGLNEAWPKPFCPRDQNIPEEFIMLLLKRVTECERTGFTGVGHLLSNGHLTPNDLANALPRY